MRFTVLLAAGLLTAATALAVPNQLMSVQIQSAAVREKAQPFGSVAGTLSYGDRVLILEESGSWCRVRKAPEGGLEGWVHVSALTEKHILLKATGSDTTSRASSDEVAIAGKGFNPQVEKQYKAGNAQLDFATIDRMVKIKVPQSDLQAFVEAGSAKGGVK